MSKSRSDRTQEKGYADELFDHPQFAQFIYYSVIMLTGLFLLIFLGRDGYIFGQAILFMIVWLALIIALEPPAAAELESEPFDDPEIIPS